MSTKHSNERTTTRRWPLLILSVPASLSIGVVAVACASEGDASPEQPREPQVIQSPEAGGTDDASTDGGAAPVDGGVVPGGACSDSGICSVDVPLDAPVNLTSVWGSGPNDVWSVGTAGTILHYDGTKWERADLEAQDAGTDFTLQAVWLDRPDDVWIADGARIRHTNGWNGPTGTEWQIYSYATTAPPISGIRGKDGVTWMSRRRATGASAGGTVVRVGDWVDGGPSSTTLYGPTTTQYTFSAVAVGRADEAWAVGVSPSSTAIPRPPTRVLRVVQVPPVTDGGAPTWRADEVSTFTTKQLYGVWASETEVWIVGEGGLIRRASTLDTPELEIVDAPTQRDLRGVFGFANDDIWAVGEQGTILHWDGESWTSVATPLDDMPDRPLLMSVWGSSPNDVWFSGSGVMLHLERKTP